MAAFDLPPLNALRVFEAAARLGSFKAAADELCVTPSAVSHQIANLEAALKVPLFDRGGRRLHLSEAGDAYRHRIHDALVQLALATDEVVAGATAPTLTVIAAPSFASKWLMPRLDDFLGARPELRIRVEATSDQRRLGTADVGIFYGLPQEPGLVVRPFIAERMLVLCSPALLDEGPPLKHASDLVAHVLIDARNRLRWRNWLAERGLENLAVRREMAVGRSTMAIEAAVSGLGVILESDFLAAEEIADGRLVEPFRESEPARAENAYYLGMRRTPSDQEPAGQFVAWLESETASTA